MYWLRAHSPPLFGVALLALGCGGSDSTGPSTGSVQVTAVSTGPDLDPDGYTVAVDGGAGQALAVNGSVTFSELNAGDHSFALSGVAPNCTPGGQNPRTVSVSAGVTAHTVFQIACVANTGTLEVTSSTTGADLDPDGYTVAVDGGASEPIAVNGSVAFSQLSAGDHSVALSGVATNCSLSGPNPVMVTVVSGTTTHLAYQVACAHIGMIAFTCQWFTSSTDSNFEICVMHADGTGLVNVTNNSAFDGYRPAWSPDGTRIAFTSDRDVSFGSSEIYVMNGDGSGVTRVTYTPQTYDRNYSSWPAWSPDGSKIAFASNRDGADAIYVMNANGSGVTRLTSDMGVSDNVPHWSPDGSKIAFNRIVNAQPPSYAVYVMNADGSGLVNMTATLGIDAWLAWSPDGSKMAFAGHTGNGGIYLINTDGTGLKRLTQDPSDAAPAWSSDGTKIAFQSYSNGWNIYVMNADGTGVVQVTKTLAFYEFPAWKP